MILCFGNLISPLATCLCTPDTWEAFVPECYHWVAVDDDDGDDDGLQEASPTCLFL